MNKEMMSKIQKARKLFDENKTEESIEKYYAVCNEISLNVWETSIEERMDFYIDFAMCLFEYGRYVEFFEILLRAKTLGELPEEILDSIEGVFLEPNLEELRQNYENNIRALRSNDSVYSFPNFEDISKVILPTESEMQFFAYNRMSRRLCSSIILQDPNETVQNISREYLLSDYLISREADIWWMYLHHIELQTKKIYLWVQDKEMFLAVLQVKTFPQEMIDRLIVFESFDEIKMYLKKTNDHLPWNIIAYTKEKRMLEEMLWSIHTERIHSEKRDRSKILLSICIPSYNRGNLALANLQKLLALRFDNEIEFVLSNNGTKNETREFYEEIKNIQDARFIYHEFEDNQGVSINACKVCDLSNGKFMMLLSDEDSIIEKSLDDILSVIKDYGDPLAIIKTVHLEQGNPGQGYAKKGEEAYRKFAFTSHYLSADIFNNKLIKKYHLTDYTREHLDNPLCYLYPHSSWDTLMMQYGDVFGTEVVLVDENGARGSLTEVDSFVQSNHTEIPEYQTVEGRCKQHKGNIDVMMDTDFLREHFDVFRTLVRMMSEKTKDLVDISNHIHYLEARHSENMDYTKKYVLSVLEKLRPLYIEKASLQDYEEDRKWIKKLYEGDGENGQ